MAAAANDPGAASGVLAPRLVRLAHHDYSDRLLSRHLGARPVVVLDGVDLHPALVDVDRYDRAAAVDERLEDVGHARALEPLGAALGQLAVDGAQRRGAGGGEHRHADELAVRLLGRDLGTDADDAAPA